VVDVTVSIVEVPEITSGWDGTFSMAEKLTINIEQPTIDAEEQSMRTVNKLAKIAERSKNNDEELIDFLTDDEEDMKEFCNTYRGVCDSYANDKRASLYEWLADSATTSHVANRHEFFTEYMLQSGASVSGVGNTTIRVEGRGTVILESEYDGYQHVLRLQNVLHIPTNKNNLISLGRWEAAGGEYRGKTGALSLITTDGRTVAIGNRVQNNLYKMQVRVHKAKSDAPTEGVQSFAAAETAKSWETWHKRFGHVSYSGLERLWKKNLVEGFNVDTHTPKPDCVACTEAKQTEEPHKNSSERQRKIGELTHIDLWGKYDITSINGHQYYILFVDDASRYISMQFLKRKDEATQAVKNYLTHLKAHGKTPLAMQTDQGTEFVNQELKSWCREQGMENQMTAPYSPAQNGVAERANRTLVELARAMIIEQELPEFLWEHAVLHAAYIRNRSYTRTLQGESTPYELWHKNKPNVAHLREFGAPVWILLQGQAMQRKLQPKSKRRAYVGFDDDPKAIKYYTAETKKVLTSRNYHFLSPPETPLHDTIVVTPDEQCEGEWEDALSPGGVQNSDAPKTPGNKNHEDTTDSESLKRKRSAEEIRSDAESPRKTRGICTDYRKLNDPYTHRLEKEVYVDEENMVNAAPEAMLGEEPKSLKEAKETSEWPEWERAIQTKLAQLNQTGTWSLVKKPTGAIPIANKWVFAKKYGKNSELLKYKGRLVAKGCSQRPGYDYLETFSPVVHLETIRAILAIAAIFDFRIQQMDVKGAYLNGTLKEEVYMWQPEGYDDGSGRICLLKKTLYGLKQSGREWNRELDLKLQKHGYTRLKADPCAYTRQSGGLEIITVWVDDLLLFATSDELMAEMKKNIHSEWEITDLGEPTKIVGIEITRREGKIIISQECYIEAILEKEGMKRANPVAMPLDPNIPLEDNPEGNEGDRSNAYVHALGELQYLANTTRPDISYCNVPTGRLSDLDARGCLSGSTMTKCVTS
jgi:transposase InsO family protein